jgi:DnaJ-class molecular chaperone
MEMPVESYHAPFAKLIEGYFDAWFLFARFFLPGMALPHRQARMTTRYGIPLHLQAEYNLLQLSAGAGLAEVHIQYRKLAKLYHPDAGGGHSDFLALQRAYEKVVEYLQTHHAREFT